jgi:hypothetical protein
MSGGVIDLGDAKFARNLRVVHSRGPVFLTRLLADWASRRLLRSELEALFRRAAEFDPADISAAGADRWPT